jgi:hypothetical protein
MLGGEAELPCFLTPSQNAKYMRISWSRSMSSQVVHVYKDGRDHPEGVMEQYSGRTKLMKDAISKGIVVLRILNVQTSDNGLYRCGFQHGSFYNDTLIELKVAGNNPGFCLQVSSLWDGLVSLIPGPGKHKEVVVKGDVTNTSV